ncbi:MAG: Asp23/Gls24 family envelope stress response protein [Clostridia bacterium]|nr:Asp23/Gls24 family envelope stress response protein [Clostridia bacterium]
MDQTRIKKHTGGLVVSEDVIAKIAGVAARDVYGVADLVAIPSDIKTLVKRGAEARAIRVNAMDSAMSIDIAISVIAGVKLNELCSKVQKAVKSSVQNMIGRPVARVNVMVIDVVSPQEEK